MITLKMLLQKNYKSNW